MDHAYDFEQMNVRLLHDKLYDDLRNGRLEATELQEHIDRLKGWVEQMDPTPKEIQGTSDTKLTNITNQIEHIVNILQEIDAIVAKTDIIHLYKSNGYYPKDNHHYTLAISTC